MPIQTADFHMLCRCLLYTSLRKPGPLTNEEREIMRKHCQIGFSVLERIPFLKEAAEIVLSHQE